MLLQLQFFIGLTKVLSNIHNLHVVANCFMTKVDILLLIIPPLDESRRYIGIIMSVHPSHYWFPDNN